MSEIYRTNNTLSYIGKWSLHVVNEHYTYICHIVCAKTIREFDDISGKYQGHIREFNNQFCDADNMRTDIKPCILAVSTGTVMLRT